MDIVAMEGDWLTGTFEYDLGFLKAGSLIRFKPKHVMSITGPVEWQIKNSSVWVSEKVVYNRERAGYFYFSSSSDDDPFDIGRTFYAESEMHKLKADIRLMKVPLAYLVDYDPVVALHLDLVAIDGVIRTSENTFEQYLKEPLDTSVYPKGYVADWEEEENVIIEDDIDLLI